MQNNKLQTEKINFKSFNKVMVFIDAANIIYSLQTLKWKMDYKKLYKFFAIETNLKEIFFYTAIRKESEKDRNWVTFLKRIGYNVKTRFIRLTRTDEGAIKPKGNLDGYIFIDVLDQINNFDTCILLGGDSDFEILIDYLHKKGKKIITCSTRGHCAPEIRKKADKYLSLQYFREIAEFCPNKKANPAINAGRQDFSSRNNAGDNSNPAKRDG